MPRPLVLAVLTLLPALHAGAQLATPPHWKVTPDAPVTMINSEVVSDTTLWFVSMAPGWHITMGPGGLLHDPRYFAEGRFDAEVEFFIFPNAPNAEIGLFLGGRNLDAASRSWTAFVIRRDGSAAVMRRESGADTMLLPWTSAPSVVAPEQSGRNVVRVAMDSAGVHFSVNGARIHSWPHGALSLDGGFGFRVGKRVNLHATRLDVTHKLAPVRKAP